MGDERVHVGAPLPAGTRVKTADDGEGVIRTSRPCDFSGQRFYVVALDRGGRKSVHPKKLEVVDGAAR